MCHTTSTISTGVSEFTPRHYPKHSDQINLVHFPVGPTGNRTQDLLIHRLQCKRHRGCQTYEYLYKYVGCVTSRCAHTLMRTYTPYD